MQSEFLCVKSFESLAISFMVLLCSLFYDFDAFPWSTIVLWNPKVHYHVHKGPTLVPVLDQTTKSTASHPVNIISPSTPRPCKWAFPCCPRTTTVRVAHNLCWNKLNIHIHIQNYYITLTGQRIHGFSTTNINEHQWKRSSLSYCRSV